MTRIEQAMARRDEAGSRIEALKQDRDTLAEGLAVLEHDIAQAEEEAVMYRELIERYKVAGDTL